MRKDFASQDFKTRELRNNYAPVKEKLEETHTSISKNSLEGIKAGIRLDSVIKAETILTLPKSFICKRIGHLTSTAIKKVNKSSRSQFN